MKSQSQPAGSTRPGPDFRHMLSICEDYLNSGDYTSCSYFAVQAHICNPNHPGPLQINVICCILAVSSSSRPDLYSILHLPQFTEDPNAINNNFCVLSDMLNPVNNPYPLAAKAHEWVIKAWTILSEPSQKALFDRELRMEEISERNEAKLKENSQKIIATFWTKCPECSCMYEYEKMYEGCCLRCQNFRCRSAFTALPFLVSAASPRKVVNHGVYFCYWFSPMGRGMKRNGGREGWKWSAPFVWTVSLPGENSAMEDAALRNEKGDGFFDISKDETDDKNGFKTEVKDGGSSGYDNCEEAKVKGVEKKSNGEKVVMKMQNTMARTSKKKKGRGIRVNLNGIFPEKAEEGEDMEVDGGGDRNDFGCGGANGEEGVFDSRGVKIEVGDDDIYVSLE